MLGNKLGDKIFYGAFIAFNAVIIGVCSSTLFIIIAELIKRVVS